MWFKDTSLEEERQKGLGFYVQQLYPKEGSKKVKMMVVACDHSHVPSVYMLMLHACPKWQGFNRSAVILSYVSCAF